jgi:hypothetical protein
MTQIAQLVNGGLISLLMDVYENKDELASSTTSDNEG